MGPVHFLWHTQRKKLQQEEGLLQVMPDYVILEVMQAKQRKYYHMRVEFSHPKNISIWKLF